MGKKYRQPTRFRDRQCETCGCFFTSQGLSGHRRYAHREADGSEWINHLKKLDQRKVNAMAYAEAAGSRAIRPVDVKVLMEAWELVVVKAHTIGISTTEADFKDFIMRKLTSEHMG